MGRIVPLLLSNCLYALNIEWCPYILATKTPIHRYGLNGIQSVLLCGHFSGLSGLGERVVKRFYYFMSLLVFFDVIVGFATSVSAELEWTFRKPVPLTSAPFDNAVSSDRQLLYMLSAEEIVVYSPYRNKTINTIPLDKDYDKISAQYHPGETD